MGISTHILNLTSGKPAPDICVRLLQEDREISSDITNADGRCPSLLPADTALTAGVYRLIFDVGDYLDGFFPEVAISFRVTDPSAHFHVPLLLTNYGFTTYRGS